MPDPGTRGMMSLSTRALRRACPLCKSGTARLITRTEFLVFDDCPVDGDSALVTCDRCGFGFSDVGWSSLALDQYYRQNEYYYSTASVGAGGGGTADSLRYASQVERISTRCPKRDSRVVDVGCGQGGLLTALTERGYTNLHAVDPLEVSVDYVRSEYGVDASLGSASAVPTPPGTADLLVYSHVLEHVLDLRAALDSAHQALKDSGLVYVEVPDARAYGTESALPYAELYMEHINHFDKDGLTNLFESHGFATVANGSVDLVGNEGQVARCLFAFFRRGEAQPIQVHRSLEAALYHYAQRGEANELWDRLRQLSNTQIPVHAWGMSQHAMLVLAHPSMSGCNVQSLLDGDSYKQTKTVRKMPVRSPAVLGKTRDCGGVQGVLLITADPYKRAIADAARNLGFSGEIVTLS